MNLQDICQTIKLKSCICYSIVILSFSAVGSAQDAGTVESDSAPFSSNHDRLISSEQFLKTKHGTYTESNLEIRFLRGRPGVSTGGSTFCSNSVRLFSLLRDEELRSNLEFVDYQEKDVERVLKRIDKAQAELSNHLANGTHSEELAKWVKRSANGLEAEIEEVLLPHQFELLVKLDLHNFCWAYGYAPMLARLRDEQRINLTQSSLDKIRKQESVLGRELARRCKKICEEVNVSLIEKLTPEQRLKINVIIGRPTEQSYWPVYLAGQLALSLNENPPKQLIRSRLLDELTNGSSWRFDKANGFKVWHLYHADYVGPYVLAVLRDSRFAGAFDLADEQVQAIEETAEWLEIANEKAVAKYKRGHANRQFLAANDQCLKKLKHVLTKDQLHELELIALNHRVAHFGLYFSILQTDLSERIDLSKKQKEEIKMLATENKKKLDKFNRENTEWYLEELFGCISDDADVSQLKNCLGERYKFKVMPIGLVLQRKMFK